MGIKLLTGNGCRVSAEDDRAFNMATISKDMFVFKGMGEMFRAEIISNNCIRIHSGEGMVQGAHFRTPYGEYDDVTINNGAQGMHRYDIIAVQYEKNTETLEESVKIVVLEGKQIGYAMGAMPPILAYGDLYKGDTLCQYPLFTVYIKGLSIESVDKNYDIMCSMIDSHPVGSLYFSMKPTDPSELFGGVWQQIKGRTLISVDEEDDDFNEAKKTGGEKEHTLTVEEIPSHKHGIFTGATQVHTDGLSFQRGYSGDSGKQIESYATGGDKAHNNLPPYITCYMWVRTS